MCGGASAVINGFGYLKKTAGAISACIDPGDGGRVVFVNCDAGTVRFCTDFTGKFSTSGDTNRHKNAGSGDL